MGTQQPDKLSDAIKTILETKDTSSSNERFERLEQKVDLILSALVVSQKDLCQILNTSPQTIINKVKSGELEKLQKDGSHLTFFTLQSANKLKIRKKRK